MPDGGASVKKGRKFDQVLAGAGEVFLRDGYEGASVDEIARVAGVSKATLYSYFPDKRRLFMEFAKVECHRQADVAFGSLDYAAGVETVLESVARQIVDFLTSDFGQRIFRMCVAESDRFPNLAQDFYVSGPAMMRDRLKALLSEWVSRGALEIDDLDLAADQLAELCKADLFPRMVFNMANSFTDDEKRRVVQGAVDTFLARYGA